jgi:hypothetical protein
METAMSEFLLQICFGWALMKLLDFMWRALRWTGFACWRLQPFTIARRSALLKLRNDRNELLQLKPELETVKRSLDKLLKAAEECRVGPAIQRKDGTRDE